MSRRAMMCVLLVVLATSGVAMADQARIVRVVDAAGRPLAGARVQWGYAGAEWPCETDRNPVMMTYREEELRHVGTAVAAADGTVVLSALAETARAVTADHRGAFAKLARDTTIVVQPLVAVTVAPTCDGDCHDTSAGGSMVTDSGITCTIDSQNWNDGSPRRYESLVPGTLDLYLSDGRGAAQRVGRIGQTVTRDVVLAPALRKIAGTSSVRGRVTLATAVRLRDTVWSLNVACGPELTRFGNVDVLTGVYQVGDLPAGACVLDVRAAVVDFKGHTPTVMYERKLPVTSGATVDVTLTPRDLVTP